MEGQRVHEYSVETGPNGLPVARLGKVHNLITFIESGKEKVHYFDGKWVDDGGHEVDETLVTQKMRDAVESLPFNPTRDDGPDTLRQCEFCEEFVQGREYADHLIKRHIRKTKEAAPDTAGAIEDAERTVAQHAIPAPAPRTQLDPNAS